ncbi:DUF4476 domain-containing protein [Caenorhabditis elegans]|uniref:DUF4476 domain-containing protein n=1 Tax=Caenorhabditis elegans TaxID=6239 RepID=C0VXW0_CAEEL|nr:DUF4476 domain-containing protein [Caenorhabditis elegans]CCD67985.1 DUF4476 domain-containing protein [Caenorhabditis elegans]|eukprot:NP_001249029.1 Uncharacterized protein CELE_Y71G12B.35 [Caenorhabditis elegans]
MKSPESADIELKARRIAYQMSRELEKTDVRDDFQNALLSLPMSETDKNVGFNAFLKLQVDIKESLKNYSKFGKKSNFLKLLTAKQLKSLDHMLKSTSPDVEINEKNDKIWENGSFSGEHVVAKTVKIVDGVAAHLPEHPIPANIPPLHVAQLYDDDFEQEDEDDLEWLSSQPGGSSSRIPDVPSEPLPRSAGISEKVPEKQMSTRKIVSRARQIAKSDAQIQTEQIEKERVDTAEIGTNCNIIVTPRVLENDDPRGSEFVEKSPFLSPISTAISDISEGEVVQLRSTDNVITVTSRGRIVATPRVIEDDDVVDHHFGSFDSNVLVEKSTSPFGVAEVDMSISSAHSHFE